MSRPMSSLMSGTAARVRERTRPARPLGPRRQRKGNGVPDQDTATSAANLSQVRAEIDEVDAELAMLLERRATLARLVQRLKPVGGFAGRDPERERRVVEGMALRAPRLGPDRLARIMNAVIEAGLEAAEEERGPRAG
jgi:chorismate mutase